MLIEQITQAILAELRSKTLLAVFDRDGTLVPINPDPAAAIMHDSIRNLLLDLNKFANSRVAILSARDLGELGNDFPASDLILAGNYGLEILLPTKQRWVKDIALKSRHFLLQAKKDVQERLPVSTKIILEDHELILCLHWHLTPPEHRNKVHDCVAILKKKYTNLLFKALPTSYEVWPSLRWDKSHGLQQIVDMINCKPKLELLLYIGDSDSDEPAFEWVNKHNGISIRVGSSPNSHARYYLKSTEEVEQLIKNLRTGMKNQ